MGTAARQASTTAALLHRRGHRAKAGRVLDLYEGVWKGIPLPTSDCILCADEKTSIQVCQRPHPPFLPPQSNSAQYVELEYQRVATILSGCLGRAPSPIVRAL